MLRICSGAMVQGFGAAMAPRCNPCGMINKKPSQALKSPGRANPDNNLQNPHNTPVNPTPTNPPTLPYPTYPPTA